MRSTEREKPSERLSLTLTATHLLETLGDPKKLRDWAETLSFQDFLRTISELNNTIRNQSRGTTAISEWQTRIGSPFDTVYFAPNLEQRMPLLQQVFDASKQLIRKGRGREAGLLLYLSIQAIHPFSDGNGRTGRALFMMLYEPLTSNVRDTLGSFIDSKEGKENFRDLVKMPQRIFEVIGDVIAVEMLGGEFRQEYRALKFQGLKYEIIDGLRNNKGLSDDTTAELQQILLENDLNAFAAKNLSLASVLKEKGVVVPQRQTDSLQNADMWSTAVRGELKPVFVINGAELVKEIDEDDARKILSRYWNAKKAVVEIVIDAIQNPAKYPHPQDSRKTLLDFMYAY